MVEHKQLECVSSATHKPEHREVHSRLASQNYSESVFVKLFFTTPSTCSPFAVRSLGWFACVCAFSLFSHYHYYHVHLATINPFTIFPIFHY